MLACRRYGVGFWTWIKLTTKQISSSPALDRWMWFGEIFHWLFVLIFTVSDGYTDAEFRFCMLPITTTIDFCCATMGDPIVLTEESWPCWDDLRGWLHTGMAYPLANVQSPIWARRLLTLLMSPTTLPTKRSVEMRGNWPTLQQFIVGFISSVGKRRQS